MVDKLKVGQTRQQVRAGARHAAASPMPFRADRWDYVYEFTRQGRTLEHRQFTVYFVDDKLARWEGDEMPPPPAQVARSGGGDAVLDKSLTSAPKTSEDNWLSALLRKLRLVEVAARPVRVAIAGAGGRMGQALIEAIARRSRTSSLPPRSTSPAARCWAAMPASASGAPPA